MPRDERDRDVAVAKGDDDGRDDDDDDDDAGSADSERREKAASDEKDDDDDDDDDADDDVDGAARCIVRDVVRGDAAAARTAVVRVAACASMRDDARPSITGGVRFGRCVLGGEGVCLMRGGTGVVSDVRFAELEKEGLTLSCW
jgi:hypothetical protein